MPCPEPACQPGAKSPASQAALAVAFGVIAVLATARPTQARDDILRGRSVTPSNTASSVVSNATNATSAQTADIAQRARAALARTVQALQQVQQAQSDAHAAAQAAVSSVPNGLAASGLQPATGANFQWVGANQPVESDANGLSDVTIKQTAQNAYLYWSSFNIGKNTTLTFDQSAGGSDIGQWIAFNKISDPSGVPSQILGSIKAGGQVYIINQNGIIFGGASQVNAHALVASSLPINSTLAGDPATNTVGSGLLNNTNALFLFTGNVVTDPKVTLNSSTYTYRTAQNVAVGATPTVRYDAPGSSSTILTPGVDYTWNANTRILTLTSVGKGKIGSSAITVSYAATNYGAIKVEKGAQLSSQPIDTESLVESAPSATLKLSQIVSDNTLNVSYATQGSAPKQLVVGADYTLSKGSDGKTTITLTQNGISKVSGASVSVTYVPVADGGRVALIGPSVENNGTISTPDGQTILAAGLQVGMLPHSSSDPSLRGLDVYVGYMDPADATCGVVTNTQTGLIDAPRADVTMTGRTVQQLGIIDCTTSVSLNGRVDLLADYNALSNTTNANASAFLFNQTGVVTLGAGSVTEILPEVSSSATDNGTQLALPSIVNIRGQAIHLASNAEILAPGALLPTGADVVVPVSNTGSGGGAPSAGVTLNAGVWNLMVAGNGLKETLLYNSGQIYLDAGASIDVFGSQNVSASVNDNIISVQLRGTELANSPVQRNGLLRGRTVQVDIRKIGTTSDGQAWVGMSLADVTGYINMVQHSVGELTTAGGSVALNAGGSVVMQPGSKIDVSGGWINYTGGTVQTTRLIVGGNLYDISQAPADLVYNGIYAGFTVTHPRWGITQTYTNRILSGAHAEPGYLQGGNGGSINIQAPAMALDGDLYGNTVAGQQQRTLAGQMTSSFSSLGSQVLAMIQSMLAVPSSSMLSLVFKTQYSNDAADLLYPWYSPTPPNIVFQDVSNLKPADPFALTSLSLRADRQSEVVLSPDLINTRGFGQLTIDNSDVNLGTITYANGSHTTLDAGSSVILSTAEAGTLTATCDGIITSAGGAMTSLRANVPISVAAGSTVNLLPGGNVGSITIPADVVLKAAPGGSISMMASNINIEGNVTVPGGSLSFTTYEYASDTASVLKFARNMDDVLKVVPGSERGKFTLGSSASLHTTGLIVDDHFGGYLPLVTNGYLLDPKTGSKVDSVSITGYYTDLLNGSVIDVSGGAAISAAGKVSYGGGGSIVINAGQDPNIPALGQIPGTSFSLGRLTLGAALSSYAGTGKSGGSLTLLAPLVQIGGNTLLVDPSSSLVVNQGTGVWGNGTTLWLNKLDEPDFFSMGGFSSFTIQGLGEAISAQSDNYIPAVVVAPGARIGSSQGLGSQNWFLTLNAGQTSFAVASLPQAARTPVSLKLKAVGVTDLFFNRNSTLEVRGELVMGEGAAIQTDPQTDSTRGVTLAGDTVAVLGSITAPGGTITITGGNSYVSLNSQSLAQALPTVDLGPGSVLSAAGVTVMNPYPAGRGYRTGSVLNGGNISVSGNIVAESGALLDVSGASNYLNLPASYSGELLANGSLTGMSYFPTRVESNGGAITLSGKQELFTDATLIGAAGGSSAQGGSLTVSSGRYVDPNGVLTPDTTTPLNPTMVVTQNGATLPASFYPAGDTAIGYTVIPALDAHGNPNKVMDEYGNPLYVLDANGNPFYMLGHFAADSFNTGGFDSLTLKGTIQFYGAVTIMAHRSISLGDGGVLYANTPVTLNAPYIALGSAFKTAAAQLNATSAFVNSKNQPAYCPPTYGAGTLTVNASLIDIGNLSLKNIGQANFIANNGDIRGDGALDVAGNITLRAGQIYPTTGVSFTIAAYDKNVTVASSSVSSATVRLASSVLPPGFGVGSAFLGSTVRSINGNTITLASNANTTIAAETPTVFQQGSGSVTVLASGDREIPLSACGTLNIYGSIIQQDGVLRAPLGAINLGVGVSNAGALDLISNQAFPVTQQLTLDQGSVTSVSAVDSKTGQALTIPYGTNADGTAWLNPVGTNLNINGLPGKSIQISAANIQDKAGSLIDISGGGDLATFQWVSGQGGSVNILANSTTTFAVIPGYQAKFAPIDSIYGNSIGNDPVSGLKAGDQVYLMASGGLPAGYYTLLPAEYALLPDAFLVTPRSGIPTGTIVKSDGSSLVNGYRYNAFNTAQTGAPLLASFEIAPQSVVLARAQYDGYYANTSLAGNVASSRLPIDAGQLVFVATNTMTIDGALSAHAPKGGLGGLVDISSPSAIYIESSGRTGPNGSLTLDSATLTNFNADSLLIGGYRNISGNNGTTITVTTSHLTVDNAGSALAGPDIILVSKNSLTLANGAVITQSGNATGIDDTLLLGNSTVGSGNGALLRVSSNPSTQLVRTGIDSLAVQTASLTPASLLVGVGVTLQGTSLTLDSTCNMSLDPSVVLNGNSVALDNGQISLQLGSLGNPQGLVLSSGVLQRLQASSKALSLLSYSSIDIYGVGQIGGGPDASGNYPVASLTLHAVEIRGFNNANGTVIFNAQNITLDNSPVGSAPQRTLPTTLPTGAKIEFNAVTIDLGVSQLNVDRYASLLAAQQGSQSVTFNLNQSINQYAEVVFHGSGGILAQGTIVPPTSNSLQGATVANVLNAQGALTLNTPLLTGVTGANQVMNAGGALTIETPAVASAAKVSSGLGASLILTGASVAANGNILLSSGELTLHATSGDLLIGNDDLLTGPLAAARLDVSGQALNFYDLPQYTNGGQISLIADAGKVNVASKAIITVAAAAPSAGGDAGSLSVSAPTDHFTMAGLLLGGGGAQGRNGTFSLDVSTFASGYDFNALEQSLSNGAFTHSQLVRLRSGNITLNAATTVQAHSFTLSTDTGSITIAGTIDASWQIDAWGKQDGTGGTINLYAQNNVLLGSGALLTVAAQNFNSANQGGSVSIETTEGKITLALNSTIGLSVANGVGGTLHLRAPQLDSLDQRLTVNSGAAPVDVAVDPIAGTIRNASSIVVEGFYVQDARSSAPASIDDYESAAQQNASDFMSNWVAIQGRLLASNSGLSGVFHIRPGEEIDNSLGNLVLNNDWNLSASSWRFGAQKTAYDSYGSALSVGVDPGILTLRAKGSITFLGSLSDGFGDGNGSISLPLDYNGIQSLWLTTLLPTFDDGTPQQSWSYRLTSGADFTSANFHSVLPLATLGNGNAVGSLLLGVNGVGYNPSTPTSGPDAITDSAVEGHYQVIRTGAGSIDISAQGDVQLLNQFATIYTAGARVSDATLGGQFDLPQTDTGASLYAPQYSQGGGSVSIVAQGNIEHLTNNGTTPDSELQMPMNWLYRRGYVDSSGQFAVSLFGEIASTTWWIDFSNFFEGVGALGGGNVTMIAGQNISNVDAVVPTNARMTKGTSSNPLAVNQTLVELGGGNLWVQAGNNIDGGVYYIERGQGTLIAGNDITTNSTRSVLLPVYENVDASAWLPTTLFLGNGSFDVAARGDLLLGPVANPFLLPQGINNFYYYKTYFSTYATTDTVQATSLAGSVTIKESVTLPTASASTSLLENWLQNVLLYPPDRTNTDANTQPWLRLAETSVDQFSTAATLMPSALLATAFSGNINVLGSLQLSPSPTGTVDFVASGAINGLQANGLVGSNNAWDYAQINLSDANPNSSFLPGIFSPYAYQAIVATIPNVDPSNAAAVSKYLDLSNLNSLFGETGSTQGAGGVLQQKQALHDASILHASDTSPLRLYAMSGDISGLTLFSAKASRIIAGNDITDIAFYIQNTSASDISVVSSGRDIIAYDATSYLRSAASAWLQIKSNMKNPLNPLVGDIQISGPGTLEVLAGRDLTLGTSQNNDNGKAGVSTAVGINSIGNERNPFLTSNGADVIAGAGLSLAAGLDNSQIDFKSFINQFLSPTTGGSLATRYLLELGAMQGLIDLTDPTTNTTTTDVGLASVDLSKYPAKTIAKATALGRSRGLTDADVVDLVNSLKQTGDVATQIKERTAVWNALTGPSVEVNALAAFYIVLRDAGRDHNNASSPGYKNYTAGFNAIAALFSASQQWQGDINLTSREIKTSDGGNISLLAPGGELLLGSYPIKSTSAPTGNSAADMGILTQQGGNISIFTHGNVNIGLQRIFTLRGGDEIIWSSAGNIAAGASPKTVQSAPPTRVLIDPQSGDVKTDLAGLSTGGGIGVLETVAGVPPGNADLIAPTGTIDAGDAGIRVSGNLNISASVVLNTGNIQTSGASSGVPTTTVAAPNISGLTSAANTTGAVSSTVQDAARQAQSQQAQAQDMPSLITVEVIGYGGGED